MKIPVNYLFTVKNGAVEILKSLLLLALF